MNLVFEKKWSHGGVKEGSFSEEFCIKKVFHFWDIFFYWDGWFVANTVGSD